jgi:hypothetical protein
MISEEELKAIISLAQYVSLLLSTYAAAGWSNDGVKYVVHERMCVNVSYQRPQLERTFKRSTRNGMQCGTHGGCAHKLAVTQR